MQTLVVYSTKHGTTREYAEGLARELPGQVTLVDVRANPTVDVFPFDQVVIGGAIYIGQVQKELKNFCARNLDTLRGKRIGLFICGMLYDKQPEVLQTAFPRELIDVALIKAYLGGKSDPAKLNFFERLITRLVSGKLEMQSAYSEEALREFAKALK